MTHRLGKNKLHELRGVQHFFGFSAKLVHFSANFGSLNVQIKYNLKNVIDIACKWGKICKYYVYSMVISLSPVKRKKGCIWVKYLIYAILSRFQIGHHLSVFSAKSVISQIQSSQRNLFFLRLMTHDTFC